MKFITCTMQSSSTRLARFLDMAFHTFCVADRDSGKHKLLLSEIKVHRLRGVFTAFPFE